MKPRGSSFGWALLKMNMLPLIILTLAVTTLCAVRFALSLNQEARNGLVNLCRAVAALYDTTYEGDYYTVDSGGGMILMKGERRLNDDFAIIDSIKEKTGVDITFFCRDVRVSTTIKMSDGSRAVGTKADAAVAVDVLEGGRPCFYMRSMVAGVRYFSYYEPLYASDGTCIGMIFLGKPSAEVEKLFYSSFIPIIAIAVFAMLIVYFVTIRFSCKLVYALQRTQKFLETVSGGEFRTEVDPDILKRRDELGDMGRCLVKMQKSLRELVELDILTGLYNRRSGEKLLRRACESCQKEKIPFCVALGDIDHFKNVNDTYGHECGDVTLAELARCIKEHMKGRGYAVRWGGEEILLVYNNMRLDRAVSCMEELMKDIRTRRIIYGETALSVTMTFGVTEGSGGKIEHIVCDADSRLYAGKNSGRDKIVYRDV